MTLKQHYLLKLIDNIGKTVEYKLTFTSGNSYYGEVEINERLISDINLCYTADMLSIRSKTKFEVLDIIKKKEKLKWPQTQKHYWN